MEIRRYRKADETLLFDLLIDEGDDWIDYHGSVGRSKYLKALVVCPQSLYQPVS